MTILEKVVTTMQQLPMDQQQQVLRFIEFLVFELRDNELQPSDRLVNQHPEKATANNPKISPRDLLRKWEGVIEDGVNDLSCNKKYMEGYGEK
ncbi:hypothetical protein H6G54_01330 [Anabaena cylindrica FACHB-243]|uniref:DUF2281 domain-containing protein n=1 Tax=Anabaena cylindrica (strain ATCC 27899 / PCC 7122) TaxID=272123 RepID=K9ZMC8_ANACC|nr:MULTISPECIES: hypothetical protein [Anabaena]AFZ60388.1 hypothetical protein Anacy_5049 [Anabaena cylindrica PCC 7122]MBD2416376.1 hypothetical protein [Anabaena cylindrica FACHB-243]MBY5285539.1 hypothetical protein [Anabaena sp. CCAP 1446/1C]MBY5307933.1 hypothetical protein [Anabaena sp. CCAP 1446/1C]MCM2408429.1 hypothetical protein [Anabaena sp. CCAP 1446/1C]